MINSLSYILIPVIFMASGSEAQIGFEQYYYVQHKETLAPVSVLNYTSPNKLYVEGRHNYEAPNTFSIYLGKSFSHEGTVKYTIAPMMGALIGKFKGASFGINGNVEYRKLFFSTQSQFTFLRNEHNTDFFFAWSELGYQPLKWFFFGLSTQHEYMVQAKSWMSDPGIVMGFTVGRWTFPIYSFQTMNDDRYFIVGINFHGNLFKRTVND